MKQGPQGPQGPVVFFDGECLFCDRSVQWVMRLDRHRVLKFAPLQGSTAAQLLPRAITQNIDAIVYWEKGTCVEGAGAVVQILNRCGGIAKLAALGIRVFPRFVRDFFYRVIARHRKRIFGSQVCALPQAGDGRFLP